MLLNTWLIAARRHFSPLSAVRRTVRGTARRSLRTESLEARSLLTALVINPDNQSLFANAVGGIEVDNADMTGGPVVFDSLVIEGISISASSGDAISVNLSDITLNSIALESIIVGNHTAVGFDIDLLNVTGLRTIAIEDVTIVGTGRGLDLTLNNTDTDALTIDDSTIPGVRVDAINGGDIGNGLITQTTIAARTGFEGILLNISSGSADNFRIENNPLISSPNKDFVRINSTNSPTDGLAIVNNAIGSLTQGAGIVFRADGDTFVQPLTLTNNSIQGERIQTFVFDVSGIGLQFDTDAITGKAFTHEIPLDMQKN